MTEKQNTPFLVLFVNGARLAEAYKPLYAMVKYVIAHPTYHPNFDVPKCVGAIVEGGFEY